WGAGRGAVDLRGPDVVARREDRDALHRVPELPHVSGPRRELDRIERGGGQPLGTDAVPPASDVEEVPRQERRVAGALAKRRHAHGDDEQPVEEVLPEAP